MFIYGHIQPITPFLPPPHSYPGPITQESPITWVACIWAAWTLSLPWRSGVTGSRRTPPLQKSLLFWTFPATACLCFSWKAEWWGFSKRVFLLSAICILSAPHWQLYSTAQRQFLSFHEQCHPGEITQGRQAGGDRFRPQKGCNKSLRGRRRKRKHIKMTECTLIGVCF